MTQVALIMVANHCGFLSNIYFLKFTTMQEVKEFHSRNNISNGISMKTYANTRKANRLALRSKYLYANSGKNDERYKYTTFFSLDNFQILDADVKKTHTYRDCIVCQTVHSKIFSLFRKNKSKKAKKNIVAKETTNKITKEKTSTMLPVNLLRSMILTAPVLKTPPDTMKLEDIKLILENIIKPINNLMSQTNHFPYYLGHLLMGRKISDPKHICKQTQRKIIQEANKAIEKETIEKDFISLYSSKQSQTEWDRQRVDSLGEYRNNRVKSHTSSLTSYTFKTDVFINKLSNGTSGIIWAKLSRDVCLKDRYGKSPKNPGQVKFCTHYLI